MNILVEDGQKMSGLLSLYGKSELARSALAIFGDWPVVLELSLKCKGDESEAIGEIIVAIARSLTPAQACNEFYPWLNKIFANQSWQKSKHSPFCNVLGIILGVFTSFPLVGGNEKEYEGEKKMLASQHQLAVSIFTATYGALVSHETYDDRDWWNYTWKKSDLVKQIREAIKVWLAKSRVPGIGELRVQCSQVPLFATLAKKRCYTDVGKSMIEAAIFGQFTNLPTNIQLGILGEFFPVV